MGSVVLRRLAVLPVLLVGIALVTFVLSQVVPGKARLVAGPLATREDVARVSAQLGLDDPVLTQFGRYLGGLARGDLGESLRSGRSVAAELADRIPATLELSAVALAIAVPLGLALGVRAARRRNSAQDYAITAGSVLAVSLPLFWIALLVAWLFGVALEWLPFSGRQPPFSDLDERTGFVLVDAALAGDGGAFVDGVRHLALPALTLAILPTAVIARVTRTAFADVLGQDYMRTAQAYGISPARQVRTYAARNALAPIITVIGVLVPLLVSGAVLVETVFAWPGLGTLVLTSIGGRDYAVITSVTLLIAVCYVLASLVVDLVVYAVDPRTRPT